MHDVFAAILKKLNQEKSVNMISEIDKNQYILTTLLIIGYFYIYNLLIINFLELIILIIGVHRLGMPGLILCNSCIYSTHLAACWVECYSVIY